jgi:hypothetical protein
MRIAKNRVRMAPTVEGLQDAQGWLVISLHGLDLEGVTELHLRMSELAELQEKQSESRSLFDTLSEKLKRKPPGA